MGILQSDKIKDPLQPIQHLGHDILTKAKGLEGKIIGPFVHGPHHSATRPTAANPTTSADAPPTIPPGQQAPTGSSSTSLNQPVSPVLGTQGNNNQGGTGNPTKPNVVATESGPNASSEIIPSLPTQVLGAQQPSLSPTSTGDTLQEPSVQAFTTVSAIQTSLSDGSALLAPFTSVGNTILPGPTLSNDTSSPRKNAVSIGMVVGGIVGGLISVVLIVCLIVMWHRRQRKQRKSETSSWARARTYSPANLTASRRGSSLFTPDRGSSLFTTERAESVPASDGLLSLYDRSRLNLAQDGSISEKGQLSDVESDTASTIRFASPAKVPRWPNNGY